LPDGNQNIVYTNFAGQVILHVFKETATGNQWRTFHKYDSQGRLILSANPSEVSGHDETKPDLLDFSMMGGYQHLRNSEGLIAPPPRRPPAAWPALPLPAERVGAERRQSRDAPVRVGTRPVTSFTK
jgi:hypothetical protein